MNALSSLWNKLARSKKYREAFVAAQVKRGIPFQIRTLRKQREGWSQEVLAHKAELTQGVISRAEDPDYGNLTLNTILRIAAGFDVAFIGRFLPFSELAKWFVGLSEQSVQVPSFDEDPGLATETMRILPPAQEVLSATVGLGAAAESLLYAANAASLHRIGDIEVADLAQPGSAWIVEFVSAGTVPDEGLPAESSVLSNDLTFPSTPPRFPPDVGIQTGAITHDRAS